MADRVSALAGNYPRGHHGLDGQAGVILCDMPNLLLQQVSAWPKTLAQVGAEAAQAVGLVSTPGQYYVTPIQFMVLAMAGSQALPIHLSWVTGLASVLLRGVSMHGRVSQWLPPTQYEKVT